MKLDKLTKPKKLKDLHIIKNIKTKRRQRKNSVSRTELKHLLN